MVLHCLLQGVSPCSLQLLSCAAIRHRLQYLTLSLYQLLRGQSIRFGYLVGRIAVYGCLAAWSFRPKLSF